MFQAVTILGIVGYVTFRNNHSTCEGNGDGSTVESVASTVAAQVTPAVCSDVGDVSIGYEVTDHSSGHIPGVNLPPRMADMSA